MDRINSENNQTLLRGAENGFRGISKSLSHFILLMDKALDHASHSYDDCTTAFLTWDKAGRRIVDPELDFQINCFIRTARHLLKLSDDAADAIALQISAREAQASGIRAAISRFETLLWQITLPGSEWVGSNNHALAEKWWKIKESYLAVKNMLDTAFPDTPVRERTGEAPRELYSFPVRTDSGVKRITVCQGDLCKSGEEYDLVVCSSYRNSYAPTLNTLIGSLLYQKNISVFMLARDCELDFRKKGVWLSKELESNFRRIACIELLEYDKRDQVELINLKSVFSTLCYLVEQAAIEGIPVRRIALPIIGSGRQKLEISYILGPLVTYCLKMLRFIDSTEEIVIYELDEERAKYTVDRLQAVIENDKRDDVFISYNSAQYEIAMHIYQLLTENAIKCWMAPQSIPGGSQYYLEIPKAINSIKVLLLLLTKDAINSKYVPKEVSASIGAGKIILPFQFGPVKLEKGFEFLLEDIQIKSIGSTGCIDFDYILEEVNRTLG